MAAIRHFISSSVVRAHVGSLVHFCSQWQMSLGAGKTTVMGLLTTEFPPSSGDASLAGFSIRDKLKETRSRIGYCPQFDALLMNLTGREHVELYGSIKGLPRSMVQDAAAAQLAAVGLSESDSDRLAYHYSGGMKRRLSLACATIGAPRLLFLDEPTTGVSCKQ